MEKCIYILLPTSVCTSFSVYSILLFICGRKIQTFSCKAHSYNACWQLLLHSFMYICRERAHVFHQQFWIPFAIQISVVLQAPSKKTESREDRQRVLCPEASAARWQHLLKSQFIADHLFFWRFNTSCFIKVL